MPRNGESGPRLGACLAALPILALALSFPAAAQAEPAYVVDDAAGDEALLVNGQATPLPNESPVNVDLARLEIDETREDVLLRVTFHPPSEAQSVLSPRTLEVHFRHDEQAYLADTSGHPAAQPGEYALFRVDPAGQSRFITGIPGGYDQATDAFTMSLPKQHLWDQNGAPVGEGNSLEGWVVQTQGTDLYIGDAVNAKPIDRLPDSGEAPPYRVKLGIEQSGIARLTSPAPVRASNGEQSAIVFPVTAHNLGSRQATFRITWDAIPNGWQVYLPNPVLDIPASSSKTQYLVASIPFGHQHGKLETLNLQMQTESDPGSVGRLALGVRYHEIPQPAGHHATLFLHSASHASGLPPYDVAYNDGSTAFMNTLSEDPEDQGIPVRAQSNGRPVTEFTWDIPLEPTLDIGLEFELGRTGQLSLTVASAFPHKSATMSGELTLLSPDGDQRLTTLPETPAFDLMPGAQVPVSIEFTPEPLRIPYTPGTKLNLHLVFKSLQPTAVTAQEVPMILPGATLNLPLLEFRDSLDNLPELPTDFRIESLGAVQKVGNPGDVLVYTARIVNDADETRKFDVTLTGANTEWAKFVPIDALAVPAHSAAEAAVIVRIPNDAGKYAVSDIILEAHESSNSEIRAILRFVTVVDVDQERSDDADAAKALEAQQSSHESGLTSAIATAALAVAFAIRRRR